MTHRLSVRHLFVLVPILGVVVGAARSITDNSFLWHVRAGTLQLDLGEVLRSDPFSFTAASESWRTQSWIADLGYGILERWTGDLAWVWPLVAATMVMTLALVAAAVYRVRPDPIPTAVVVALVTWLSLQTLVPRPVVFSHLLLAALIVALGHRRARWTIPLLLWLWASVHGSFIVGLGLIVLEAIRTADKRLARTAGMSAMLVSVTAHGLALWAVLGRFAESRGALDLITEWAPPRLTQPEAWPYALLLVLLLMGAAGGAIRPRDLIVVAPFMLFGLTSFRALFPAMIVLAPWAVSSLPSIKNKARTELYAVNVAIALVLVAGAVALGWARSHTAPDDERFPIAASAHVDPGPLFHDDAVGGYLIYADWPERLVYVDDRAELYGTERFERFVDVRGGLPAWRDAFGEYGIGQALLRADVTGLQEVLTVEGWIERFRDENFVVLVAP